MWQVEWQVASGRWQVASGKVRVVSITLSNVVTSSQHYILVSITLSTGSKHYKCMLPLQALLPSGSKHYTIASRGSCGMGFLKRKVCPEVAACRATRIT